MEQHDDKLYCPKCGSSNLITNKKGFGAGKAVTGALLTGGIGILAGFIGSSKIKITCLQCGSKWKPGELRNTPINKEEQGLNDMDSDFEDNKVDGLGIIGAIIVTVVFSLIFATLCS